MKAAEVCTECRRLSQSYESVTMAWFRTEGNLRIAEYGRDEASSGRLVAELSAISEERRRLKQELDAHRAFPHPEAVGTSA